MRFTFLPMLGLGFGLLQVGCSSDNICDLTECYNPSGSGGAGGTGATTSNTGGGSGTGGNGTGGGLPVACELTDGEAIPATCTGVYVSASAKDDSGDGSRGAPFQTLAAALKANAKTIYLCGDADNAVKGSATIMKTVALQGGFGCDDWTYHADTKTKLLGDADKPALTVKGASTQVALYDLAIEAPNAVAEGASAIGVLVSDAHAEFWRVSVKAGKGAVGKRGANGATDRAHSGEPGNPGVKACASTSLNSGGIPVPNSVCGSSVGGRGGDSTTVKGGDGSNGEPVSGSDGKGGIGESSVPVGSSWSCTTGSGSIGASGASGASGAGATGVGTLTAAGWQGVIGIPGDLGGPGQGGGGGGAAKGSAIPVGSHPQCAGASGGSGGAGGCGGVGGEGGFAGGASIAIESYNATVVLHATGLITVGGGTGGQGGDGQLGGKGGDPGAGGESDYAALLAGCKGGDGGPGGNGGGGGGGLGGASVGIAYVGTAPTKDDDVTFEIGAAGAGGAAGPGGTAGTPSASGPTGEISQF